MQFSSREHKLLAIVKRLNYGKKAGENGIGMQMLPIYFDGADGGQATPTAATSTPTAPGESAGGGGGDHTDHASSQSSSMHKFLNSPVYWYHLSDNPKVDSIHCVKWTNTLLLGTAHAAAVLIQVRNYCNPS
jgi:hypothetical protein